MPKRLLPLLALATLAACVGEGPKSGPGTMTATVVSPNGAEGAAVVFLLEEDLGAISGVGATEVYAYSANGSTQIVVIHPTGGELVFEVAVPDTTQPPAFVLAEVAGPDDELRGSLSGYTLELVR